MTMLEHDSLGVELGVDAQQRESPLLNATENGFLGRATVRWSEVRQGYAPRVDGTDLRS